jgi:UDP-N-acetyl-D-galactosamine dehydrogenase
MEIPAQLKGKRLGVIGLGYVGLPLVVEFSKLFPVVGFDINPKRVEELGKGIDKTGEVTPGELEEVLKRGVLFTTDPAQLEEVDIYLVTVPTPIDRHKNPDLGPLKRATETIGKYLKPGDLVIYESTVYPGCTEEVCVPILERESGLKLNRDFWVGYSPERINPGDRNHKLTNVVKVTSGSSPEAAEVVDSLYRLVVKAGTHRAPSIKVAETAKVIENSQRDINIAFVNELALICDRLGIDTLEVLEAAGTKWNFLRFKPGLVGGHCIGVDPYYLTYKAKELNYHPEVILAGRRLNDNMGIFVANKVVKLLIKKGHKVKGSKVLVLGITFKENCPDIRNTRVIDLVRELQEFGIEVDVTDPYADPEEVWEEYRLELADSPRLEWYDGIVLAVAHDKFKELVPELYRIRHRRVIYDVKGLFPKELVDGRL